MTKQEIFDRVWDHFIVKNAPFGWDSVREICVYGGDGLPPCAIGLFDTEGLFIGSLARVTDLPPENLEKVFGKDYLAHFLLVIQQTHDSAARNGCKAEMRARLRAVAADFNLEVQE